MPWVRNRNDHTIEIAKRGVAMNIKEKINLSLVFLVATAACWLLFWLSGLFFFKFLGAVFPAGMIIPWIMENSFWEREVEDNGY